MLNRRVITASAGLVVVVGLVALCGCAKTAPQPVAEQVPQPPQTTEAVSSPPPQTMQTPEPPAAKVDEVQAAVKRIFNDAAVVDSSHVPSFLVGDFNGDLSQDLAVVLKPAEGKLSELNQEFPRWMSREPLRRILLSKSKVLTRTAAVNHSPSPAAGQTVRFEQGDVLLAIIHGNGPKGWRDIEATQTQVLRDVVGANLRTLPFKSAARAYMGIKPFPIIQGDLIQETLIGQSGFLHFSGGIYDWYDPRSYKAEAAPAHSGMSSMR